MAAQTNTQENHNTGSFSGAGSQPSPSDMFDPISAGAYLGGAGTPISRAALAEWRGQGKGPAYVKIGHLVRYQREDLDAFKDAGRVVPGAK